MRRTRRSSGFTRCVYRFPGRSVKKNGRVTSSFTINRSSANPGMIIPFAKQQRSDDESALEISRAKLDALTRSGFTLLEVVIAVLIIGLLTISIYRFVAGNLNALQISSEIGAERQLMVGLVNLIEG